MFTHVVRHDSRKTKLRLVCRVSHDESYDALWAAIIDN